MSISHPPAAPGQRGSEAFHMPPRDLIKPPEAPDPGKEFRLCHSGLKPGAPVEFRSANYGPFKPYTVAGFEFLGSDEKLPVMALQAPRTEHAGTGLTAPKVSLKDIRDGRLKLDGEVVRLPH